ncbi:MAG: ATP-binding protein [Syntrophomonadaceae bacterium]|nr:ATP-binding protein [Syntrophomonadaceae bacterium]
MRRIEEIESLLNELENRIADELEDQDLDFKEWIFRSFNDSISMVVDMAICMANGGGGTIVFGIKDRVTGRAKAIIGVPPEVDVNKLKQAVYDRTDPKLTPVFEELRVPEGTGRIIVMQVHQGLPPYTDTSGAGKIRIGKDCQPLTGTMRRRILVETGDTDYTAEQVSGNDQMQVSSVAVDYLRNIARHEQAPEDILKTDDIEFLTAIGLIQRGRVTRAGLLLAGSEEAIKREIPSYAWTYLKMKDETNYVDRIDGKEALSIAIAKIMDRIMASNPITTLEYGMFHFEYRTYPEIAIREALMNAFSHADYRMSAPIIVKQYPDRLEISNPGGFIGGITPNNILHHQPVSRNPHLVEVLTRLRLVNRSNLGIPRIYRAMMMEGKHPPLIDEQGDAVKITLLACKFTAPFRAFVAEEEQAGRDISIDHMLILQYLIQHPEIDTSTAAHISYRKEEEARRVLSSMESERGYLERGGTGRGTYWLISRKLHNRLMTTGDFDNRQRTDWDAAKTRVLSILIQRAKCGEKGLSNSEIRQITMLSRYQVIRLMHELQNENPKISLKSRGRYSTYSFDD